MRSRAASSLLSGVLLVAGVGLLCAAVGLVAYAAVLRMTLMTTEGEVVEIVGSESFTVTSSIVTNPPAYELGQHVDVLYDPASPSDGRLVRQTYFVAMVFTIVGGVFVLGRLLLRGEIGAIAWQDRRRRRRLRVLAARLRRPGLAWAGLPPLTFGPEMSTDSV